MWKPELELIRFKEDDLIATSLGEDELPHDDFDNFVNPVTPNVFEVLLLSCFIRIRIFATPWSAAYQVPLPMGFSRQENVGSHQKKRMPHTQGQRRSPSKTISSVQFSSVQ